MKQVLQNLATGKTMLVNVPAPSPKAGHALIATSQSLVSVGTERMLIEFGKANLLNKAKSQPEKVQQVLEKVRTDGLTETIQSVRAKLDQPLPLGYCNVGKIIDPQDTGFATGQRVVSNGHHAEIVSINKNLIAEIPENVSDEAASFTVVGSIALQGIRLIKPNLGETIVVTGLGLIGLLAVQILRANGCRVLAIDIDSRKCELAARFGAEIVDLSKGEDAIRAAEVFSRGQGVDGVLITASSKDNEIINQSAKMCRKRGRIVLIGVIGLELQRTNFYEKELTFQVSCSYGPGRYDKEYEEKGIDYPLAFVRWTEQRNFEAVLDLMSTGSIDTNALITHRFDFDAAATAYTALDDPSALGILMSYKHNLQKASLKQNIELSSLVKEETNGSVIFVGAGNYASRTLIPAFINAGAQMETIVTATGLSAFHYGSKNKFSNATTDYTDALKGCADTVVIATRHNLHADQIVAALNAGKNVFVEKPLALNHDQINRVEKAYADARDQKLMVGFNRRFSPHIKTMKKLLNAKKAPKTIIMTMNAGEIESDHWTQDRSIGGGRIIGEACHYIDLMRFLVNSKITAFTATKMGGSINAAYNDDKSIITLEFDDGSIGSIHYFANGSKAFPKERIEVFCEGTTLQIDNFRKMHGYGFPNFKRMNLWRQNKGQVQCCKAFMNSIFEGTGSPIVSDEIFEIARISVDVAESLSS